MTIYIINIILIICEGLWLLYQVPSRRNRKLFCFLASLQWILISGLRHISVGADTKQYYNNFERIKTYSWDYVLDFARTQLIVDSDAKAPGYTLIVKIFQIFCDKYQVYLIFVAIVFFGCMGYSIYKNSKNPALSFILFSCLFYSFFAITGIRQTIATAVVVFVGIELIKKRKLVLFLICILVMSTIHLSVLCFIPFFWMSKIHINKKNIAIYWSVIVIAFVFRNRFMMLLQLFIGYEDYTQTEGARASTFLYLLILIALVITIFHLKIIGRQYNKSNVMKTDQPNDIPMIQLSMNAIFIACIFSSLLLINQNTMRVVQYYSLLLLYFLPEIPNMFANRQIRWIYNIVVVLMLIALSMDGNYQYYFFWQNV